MAVRFHLIIIAAVACIASPWQFKQISYAKKLPFRREPSWKLQQLRPVSPRVLTQMSVSQSEIEPCFYKTSAGWKKRIQLNELEVGQKIFGEKIPGTDLLDGKTGPKLFFECGIGRIDAKGEWKMVSAMLRFQTKYKKISVIRKRAAKFSGKPMELYVHKIRLDNGKLEVCADHESLLTAIADDRSKSTVPASSLKVGQEVTGTVIEVRPYGCLVDVGANRKGLLHIQKVADLYGTYINKEKGLEQAGLEKGAVIRISVLRNEKKRLALDFTPDVKQDAKKEAESASLSEVTTKIEDDQPEESEVEIPDSDEAAVWGAYSADDYEDDEDRDIEDALGLASY